MNLKNPKKKTTKQRRLNDWFDLIFSIKFDILICIWKKQQKEIIRLNWFFIEK